MLEKRVHAFKVLGEKIKEAIQKGEAEMEGLSPAQINLLLQVKKATLDNGWFRKDMVYSALDGIVKLLDSSTLGEWVGSYTLNSHLPKKVGIVMAGNIPAVGFHDLLCVLISGNIAVVKTSSDDGFLIPAIARLLIEIDGDFSYKIEFLSEPMKDVDAVLATGSNNSARYFEQYFGKYPNVIRKSRTSVAVISGDETDEDIAGLASDLFTYFGLGCRNVSKLLVKKGVDIEQLMIKLSKYEQLLDHSKYHNNLDYNKSIYIINREPFLDGGLFLFREDQGLHSPISVTYFEYFDNFDEMQKYIDERAHEIQCVVGKQVPAYIGFGDAQKPSVSDYADGVDTMAFLQSL